MKIRQNGAVVQLADKKMTTLIPVRIKWHGGRKKVIPAATLQCWWRCHGPTTGNV